VGSNGVVAGLGRQAPGLQEERVLFFSMLLLLAKNIPSS
jgi:hypothetical protein